MVLHWLVQTHSTAKTQTAPPSGTSGYSPGKIRLRVLCMRRASPDQPDTTATYCLPPTEKEVGGATIPELVGNSHNSLPVDASKACSFRSFVPPLNTSPPPVDNIGPQFG